MFRLLATPLVVWLIYIGNYAWGLPIFLAVALTDAMDGSMARTRDQITKWGIVFDPIADKLLVGSVLIVLVLQNLSHLLGIAIITIEAIVALGGLYSHRTGDVHMANYLGKMKMLLQVFGLAFLIIAAYTGSTIMHSLATITLATSIAFAVSNVVAFGLRKAI
jgi:phosphatidylglycerophosphate synthase